jgi:hypothetical protein
MKNSAINFDKKISYMERKIARPNKTIRKKRNKSKIQFFIIIS